MRYLSPSIIYSVPCDRIVQMAWIKDFFRVMFVIWIINYEFTCVISLNCLEENLNRIVDGPRTGEL